MWIDQIRLIRKSVDLVDGHLQCADDVGVRGPVEPNVGIADLDKTEVRGPFVIVARPEQAGYRDPAGDAPNHAASDPLHALQEAPTVNFSLTLRILSFHKKRDQSRLQPQDTWQPADIPGRIRGNKFPLALCHL